MSVLSHGEKDTVSLPALNALTVIASVGGSGVITRLGDAAGQEAQGYQAIASGETKIIGPFSVTTHHEIRCTNPTLTVGVATVDFPTESEVQTMIDAGAVMTTAGDIIVGGLNGAPTRLAAGNDGDVLTIVAGVPAWVAPA